MEKYKNLKEIIKQIEMSKYECIGGYLKNNIAFIQLKEFAETNNINLCSSSLKLEEKEIPSFITWLKTEGYTTDEYGFILDRKGNEHFRKDIENIYKDKYNL